MCLVLIPVDRLTSGHGGSATLLDTEQHRRQCLHAACCLQIREETFQHTSPCLPMLPLQGRGQRCHRPVQATQQNRALQRSARHSSGCELEEGLLKLLEDWSHTSGP
jgi:hypothetical protein